VAQPARAALANSRLARRIVVFPDRKSSYATLPRCGLAMKIHAPPITTVAASVKYSLRLWLKANK
jgi:hypothetical protein